MAAEGDTSSVCELLRERVGRAEACEFEGEGDREERWGAARPVVVSDGAEGDVRPRRICLLGAVSWECWRWTAWMAEPFGFELGYRGLAEPVRLRVPAVSDDEERLRLSKTMRLEGLVSVGKVEGPAEGSLRLISSK
jgi:hypothetical protein